jgi:hypothetical protein
MSLQVTNQNLWQSHKEKQELHTVFSIWIPLQGWDVDAQTWNAKTTIYIQSKYRDKFEVYLSIGTFSSQFLLIQSKKCSSTANVWITIDETTNLGMGKNSLNSVIELHSKKKIIEYISMHSSLRHTCELEDGFELMLFSVWCSRRRSLMLLYRIWWCNQTLFSWRNLSSTCTPKNNWKKEGFN